MRDLFDSFRFWLACLIAGDLIDKLAIGAALRAGERRWLAGYRRGVQDAKLLNAIRRPALRVVEVEEERGA